MVFEHMTQHISTDCS